MAKKKPPYTPYTRQGATDNNAPRRRPKYYPDELDKKFTEYLEEAKYTTWYKVDAIRSGERAGELIKIPQTTPLTIWGFCKFANITVSDYNKYANNEAYDDVTTRVKTITEGQQLEGAIVGVYNPNIVARLVGLADRQEVQTTSNEPRLSITIDGKELRLGRCGNGTNTNTNNTNK